MEGVDDPCTYHPVLLHDTDTLPIQRTPKDELNEVEFEILPEISGEPITVKRELRLCLVIVVLMSDCHARGAPCPFQRAGF